MHEKIEKKMEELSDQEKESVKQKLESLGSSFSFSGIVLVHVDNGIVLALEPLEKVEVKTVTEMVETVIAVIENPSTPVVETISKKIKASAKKSKKKVGV